MEDGTVTAEFTAVEGARERFTLTWHLSYRGDPAGRGRRLGARPHRGVVAGVERALPVRGRLPRRGADLADRAQGDDLETTGALIAAPTTSLPEDIGGVRNWDYRYCWLRDSVLALEALLAAGYTDEALAFRDFMLRVAHRRPDEDPDHVRDRRRAAADRVRAPGTSRLRGSRPVRVGNAASEQFQLDVYGEVAAVMFVGAGAARQHRQAPVAALAGRIEHVETIWREPDDGIWEARGPQRHYTYSKVMAWVVFDRAVRLAERFDLEAPLERWKQVRDEIHAEVCEQGYDPERSTFTQYYGSKRARRQRPEHPARGLPAGHATSASPARSTRSRASSVATASSRATRPPRPTTACRATRASSWPARSGS